MDAARGVALRTVEGEAAFEHRGASTMTEADLLDLDRQRCDAMIARSRPRLMALFRPDLIWIHSTGKKDTRASLIASLEAGEPVYHRIDCSDLDVRIFNGSVAFVSGAVTMDLEYQGVRTIHSNRYSSIWIEDDDGIRMAAWQSAGLPHRRASGSE